MSSDEEDYMSEKFLLSCTETDDVRPGLLHSHTAKRKHELEKKKKNADEIQRKKMRPLKELQEEKLKEGMQTPLDSSNKGFSLMEKMGYKSGMSLGKRGTGIIEPVPVNIKYDRIGLGWQQLLAEKRKRIEENKKYRTKEFDPIEFRMHKSKLHNKKLIEGDLKKSQRVCYELDFKEGNLSPPEYWFWPEHTWEDEEYDEEEEYEEAAEQDIIDDTKKTEEASSVSKNKSEDLNDIFDPSDQLQILTSYLRSTYSYCIWCCTEFADLDDLETNCPGPSRADHND